MITQRVAARGGTLHVEVVALVEAAALGPVGQVTARVLEGHVLGQALVVGHVGAGDVDVGLRGGSVARGSAGRGLVLVRGVFGVCGEKMGWSERKISTNTSGGQGKTFLCV